MADVHTWKLECLLWALVWPVCFSINRFHISDTGPTKANTKAYDLLTNCPYNYVQGEKAHVGCYHLNAPPLTVPDAQCLPKSKGVRIFNGTEVLGSSNCEMVDLNAMDSCRIGAMKNASAHPKCSCRYNNAIARFQYEVEFYPDRLYDNGRMFHCRMECLLNSGDVYSVALWEDGHCHNVTVDCNSTTYGVQCNGTCGRCADKKRCDQDSGWCEKCEPGFSFPLCQTCEPYLTGPDCDQCEKEGFQPYNCTECTPRLALPDCQHCIQPGFLPPECTRCKMGLLYPDCVECIRPGFMPPNCTECMPQLKLPDCRDCRDPILHPPNCTARSAADCNSTTYGVQCNGTCGRCADKKRCDQDSGWCEKCEPGFSFPLCQTCEPYLTGPDCDQCEKEGFQPYNCTECTPRLALPDCQHCIQPGFLPPECTRCKMGLLYPDCVECIRPGFMPPNCTECMPQLKLPDCRDCRDPILHPPNCTARSAADCNSTTYGVQCNGTCGRCADKKRCDQDSGWCEKCEPGFSFPLCQTCEPYLTGPDCDQCEKEGFQPYNCTECTPRLALPDCQHCIQPGFLPPECTRCKMGLLYPDCVECIRPGFMPPNCTECMPQLKLPDCRDCRDPILHPPNCTARSAAVLTDDTTPPVPADTSSGLTTAQTIAIAGGGLLASGALVGSVAAYMRNLNRMFEIVNTRGEMTADVLQAMPGQIAVAHAKHHDDSDSSSDEEEGNGDKGGKGTKGGTDGLTNIADGAGHKAGTSAKSVTGASKGAKSVTGASKGAKSVTGASKGAKSVTGASKGAKSVTGASKGAKSVTNASKGAKSVTDASKGAKGVIGASKSLTTAKSPPSVGGNGSKSLKVGSNATTGSSVKVGSSSTAGTSVAGSRSGTGGNIAGFTSVPDGVTGADIASGSSFLVETESLV